MSEFANHLALYVSALPLVVKIALGLAAVIVGARACGVLDPIR